MDSPTNKRDRLLRRTARVTAGAALLTSFVVASAPETGGTIAYWVVLPFYLAAGLLIARLESGRPLVILISASLAELAIAFCLVIIPATPDASATLAVTTLLVASASGLAMTLLVSPAGYVTYWLLAGITATVAGVVLHESPTWLPPALLTLLGWAAVNVIGYLLVSSIPTVLRQVSDIGAAQRAERHASELEAQRRHSARLLHDTVLATLTLLAHSGIGVSGEALRSQARNDAHLLRQLRLGEPLLALPDAGYTPELVEESTLGTTLERVRERFERLSLDVQWHGATRIALPQPALDAFLYAISECLENVRRHAGVGSAHVTITDDTTTVRAMITDAGRGFDPDLVDAERLGLQESVIARMQEIGGSARVFSAPGAGTTVLLEAPR